MMHLAAFQGQRHAQSLIMQRFEATNHSLANCRFAISFEHIVSARLHPYSLLSAPGEGLHERAIDAGDITAHDDLNHSIVIRHYSQAESSIFERVRRFTL